MFLKKQMFDVNPKKQADGTVVCLCVCVCLVGVPTQAKRSRFYSFLWILGCILA